MRRYSVVYKLRYKKVSPVTSIIMEGYKELEIRDRFKKEIQKYNVWGEPLYTIIRVRVLWDNNRRYNYV